LIGLTQGVAAHHLRKNTYTTGVIPSEAEESRATVLRTQPEVHLFSVLFEMDDLRSTKRPWGRENGVFF